MSSASSALRRRLLDGAPAGHAALSAALDAAPPELLEAIESEGLGTLGRLHVLKGEPDEDLVDLFPTCVAAAWLFLDQISGAAAAARRAETREPPEA